MTDPADRIDTTRRSWNLATRNHNAHKGNQAEFLRNGGELLFPEELALLGDLTGQRLVHLQCNAGQDSLCLARRGAAVTGIDLADEAINVARQLSTDAGIPASFVQAELLQWFEETEDRFDVAFASYGATGWLPDLERWATGVHRVLRQGGRFVYVEFHPTVWSLDPSPPFGLTGDDYFATHTFWEPVQDYVAESGPGLGAVQAGQTVENAIPAASYQHGLAQVVQALLTAGMQLDRLVEWPYSNGCRLRPGLVSLGDRRYGWPEGTASLPLMYGIRAHRP